MTTQLYRTLIVSMAALFVPFTAALEAHISAPATTPVVAPSLATATIGQLRDFIKNQLYATAQRAKDAASTSSAADEAAIAAATAALQQEIAKLNTSDRAKKHQELVQFFLWSTIAPLVITLVAQKDDWNYYLNEKRGLDSKIEHAKQLSHFEKILSNSPLSSEITLAQLQDLVRNIREDLDFRTGYIAHRDDREEIIALLENREAMLKAHLFALQESLQQLTPQQESHTGAWIILGLLTTAVLGSCVVGACYDFETKEWGKPRGSRLTDNAKTAWGSVKSVVIRD